MPRPASSENAVHDPEGHAPLIGIQRAFRIQWGALGMSVIYLAFALINSTINDAPRMAGTSFVASLVAIAAVLFVTQSRRYGLAANLLVCSLAVQVFGEMLFNGGLEAPATPLLLLIVPAAIFLGTLRDTIAWMIAVGIGLISLTFLDFFELTMPTELIGDRLYTDKALTLIIGIIGSAAMVSAFSLQTGRALRQLEIERAEFKEQATHDALTGLPNRNQFYPLVTSQIQQAVLAGRCGLLVFLDLDGFKGINDGLGHEAGDELLVELARRLRSIFPTPALVARFAGDEFVVFTTHSEGFMADQKVASTIAQLNEEEFEIAGATIQVGVSYGVARLGQDGTSLRELISAADDSMYAMKRYSKSSRKVDVQSELSLLIDKPIRVESEID